MFMSLIVLEKDPARTKWQKTCNANGPGHPMRLSVWETDRQCGFAGFMGLIREAKNMRRQGLLKERRRRRNTPISDTHWRQGLDPRRTEVRDLCFRRFLQRPEGLGAVSWALTPS